MPRQPSSSHLRDRDTLLEIDERTLEPLPPLEGPDAEEVTGEHTKFVRAPSVPAPFVAGVQTGARLLDQSRVNMRLELSKGNYEAARAAALEILSRDPTDTEAFELAESCHDYLFREYVDRLGSLEAVPQIRYASDEIVMLDVDHRAGFVLHLIDGSSTVENVLDACGMDRLDALRILHLLVARGIVEMWKSP